MRTLNEFVDSVESLIDSTYVSIGAVIGLIMVILMECK